MKDIFKIELTRTKVLVILNAFIRGDVSSDELKTWAVSMMDAKEKGGILDYDTVIGDIILDIEMSEAHTPIIPGKARDFIQELTQV
jgi:hypothetical protein